MLRKLDVKMKLSLIVLVFSTVLVGTAAYTLLDLRNSMFEDRKAKLRSLVEVAVTTVDRYGELAAQGKMPLEEAQKAALAALAGMNFDGKNYFFVFDRQGILKMHPSRKDDLGKNMLTVNNPVRFNYIGYLHAANTAPAFEGFSQFVGRRPGSQVNDAPKLFLSAIDNHWNWVVTTGIFVDDVNGIFLHRAAWLGGAVISTLILSLIFTMLIGRSIAGPLNETVGALDELNKGHFDVQVAEDDSNTEIGKLNRTFVQFREKLKETEELRARQVDAERQAEVGRRNAVVRFADEFDTAVGSVVEALFVEIGRTAETVAELSKSAQASAAGSERIGGAASSVSEGIQTVASAAQELSASIGEIGRQVHKTRDIARLTRSQSLQTEQRVSALSETVETIGSIIDIITGIAEQTNLLALNATIEAARAGDAGKGFSVVASEVKALASQTTKATEDIRRNIDAVRDATRDAVDSVRMISSSINGLDESAGAIAAAIEEQNAATSEISRNTNVTAERTLAITQAITDVVRSVSGTDRSARQVEEFSTSVRGRSEEMRHEVHAFLRRIRAA
jgi:methyl-accepting chemotaxis protein